MKKILFLSLIFTLSFSKTLTIQKLIQEYKKEHYKFVCLQGARIYRQLARDEKLIMMYAFSCLKSDFIDRLATPIMSLGRTKDGRRNRAYFSIILMEKNLLLHSLTDHEDFQDLKSPITDHIISKVYNLYYTKRYTKKKNIYLMNDHNITYKVYIDIIKRRPYLIIEEYNGTKNIKHMYR